MSEQETPLHLHGGPGLGWTPPPTKGTPSDDGPIPFDKTMVEVRLTVELKSGRSATWTVDRELAEKFVEIWLDGGERIWLSTDRMLLSWSTDAIAQIEIEPPS